MSAAVALRYEDDTANPVALRTVVHVEATGLTVNETQTHDNIVADPPVKADPITYYLTAEHAIEDDLVSVRFQGEEFTWDDVIFPASGAWTVHVRKDEDDTSVANVAVTVDAE